MNPCTNTQRIALRTKNSNVHQIKTYYFVIQRLMLQKVLGTSAIILVFSLLSCREDDISRQEIIIAKFPENKEAAVSFTFDDGYPSGYETIAPLFEQYGYSASFFLIVGNIRDEASWDKWRKLANQGFEIGNHSLTHLNLKDVYDTAILKKEICDSYDILKEKMGKAPFSFAHPYHCSNPIANAFIFSKHYASRLDPKNFCQWEAWPSKTGEGYVKKKINQAMAKNLWYVPCAHGIGDGWGPISKDLLVNILDYVKLNESRIYVDKFETIAKYTIERENTSLVVSSTENGKVIELRSLLDENVFNMPLVIVLKNQRFSPSLSITSEKEGSEIVIKSVDNDILIYAKLNSVIAISW